jgi:hypothetical protein
MIGSPSELFFPTWARRVIDGFLKNAARLVTPAVLLMVDPTKSPSRHLVFNVHPENFSSLEDFQHIMNRLGWFLPARRSCIALSGSAFDASAFQPLVPPT